MATADNLDTPIAKKIDLSKGKLPFKGKGLSGCVDINSKSIERETTDTNAGLNQFEIRSTSTVHFSLKYEEFSTRKFVIFSQFLLMH